MKAKRALRVSWKKGNQTGPLDPLGTDLNHNSFNNLESIFQLKINRGDDSDDFYLGSVFIPIVNSK